MTGESVWDMWKSEVLSYTFSTSLIDVAGVAMMRFLLLVLAYGAIQMNHWTIVAVSILFSSNTSKLCTCSRRFFRKNKVFKDDNLLERL